MSLQKITEAEMDEVSVARLPTRPNEGRGVENGMSAARLQAAFDAFGRLNAERYNALLDALTDGTFATEMMIGDENVAGKIASSVVNKYEKPQGGIPASDLSAEVQSRLIARDAGGLFITY